MACSERVKSTKSNAHRLKPLPVRIALPYLQDDRCLLDLALEASIGLPNAQLTNNLKTVEVSATTTSDLITLVPPGILHLIGANPIIIIK